MAENIVKKELKDSIPGMIIVGITVLSALSGIIPSEDGQIFNVLGVSGYMIASILFAKRCLTAEWKAKILKGCMALSVISAVIAILGGIIHDSDNLFFGVILNSIVGAGIMIILFRLVDTKAAFIEICDNTKFWIVIAGCILVIPSVIFMLSGIVITIIEVLIFLVLLYFVLSGGMAALGDMIKEAPKTTQYKTVYLDDNNNEHDTAYGRDEANKVIRGE